MTVLVFLESAEQYQVFEKDLSLQGRRVVCALTPYAIHFCENNGIEHIRAPDCFTQAEYEEGKKASESRLEELRAYLNRFGEKVGREKVSFPLELGNYFSGLSLPTLGCLHHRAFVLMKVIAKVKPDRIVAFRGHAEGVPYLNLLFSPNDDICVKILENSVHADRCLFLDSPRAVAGAREFYGLKSALRRMPLIHDLYELKKHGAKPRDLLKHFIFQWVSRGRSTALVIGPLYNFGGVVLHHRFSRLRFKFFWGEEVSAEGRLSKDLLPYVERWTDSCHGTDIGAVFGERLNMILNTAKLCCDKFSEVAELLDGADVVLSSCFLFPLQQMAGHIAKSKGKKVIVWTHGSKGITDAKLSDESNDFFYSDYILTFGDSVTNYYKSVFPQYKNTAILSVGSVQMGKISRNTAKSDASNVILYATGKYTLASGFTDLAGADELLYDAQKALMQYLIHQRHAKVLWKLNPTPYMGQLPFAAEKTDNIKLVHFEKSFTELLRDARIVILDSPSTAAIEAAASDKPIFALISRLKYRPQALALLKKRAVVRGSVDELLSSIEKYFLHGQYPADLNDRSFAKAYGTHEDLVPCEDRAIDIIFSALGK